MEEEKEEKKVTDKVFTIPNYLSSLRILLIPIFIYVYNFLGNDVLALTLIVISGISDVLDGYIARKYNLITKIGKILDPVADKGTQVAVLFSLLYKFNYMIIPFLFLLIKELVLLIFGSVLFNYNKEIVASNLLGKAAAFSIYFMLFVHLLWGIWGDIPATLSYIIVGTSLACMSVSFISYINIYIKEIKTAKGK